MTLEEALAELGIDDAAGPDQARRAYLRLLKTRKPETDPQGFMRLREAYDEAKPHLERRDTWLRARAAEAAREPEAVAEPVAEPVEAHEPEAVAEPMEAHEPEVTRGPETASGAVDAAPGREEPAPRSEDAPRSPAPIEEPVDHGEAHEGDGHEGDGHDDEHHPEPSRAPPTPASIHALLDQGRHEEAAGELARLFDEAVERSEDVTPAVGLALRLILMLFARSSAPAAAALGASLFDYLRASGQEARAIRGEDAARWTILRELAALSPSFPDPVRAAIAHAAMEGDLGESRPALAALQARRPGAAAEAAIALRRRAPVIAAAVADTLDPPAPPPTARRGAAPASGGRSSWAYGAVAIGIFRLLMMLARTDPSPSGHDSGRYEPSRATPRYTPAGVAALLDAGAPRPAGSTTRAELRQSALDHAARAKAHADYALGGDPGAGRASYDLMSSNAADAERAVRQTRCFEARLSAQATSLLFQDHGMLATDERGRGEAAGLVQAVRAYCEDLEAGPDGGATRP